MVSQGASSLKSGESSIFSNPSAPLSSSSSTSEIIADRPYVYHVQDMPAQSNLSMQNNNLIPITNTYNAPPTGTNVVVAAAIKENNGVTTAAIVLTIIAILLAIAAIIYALVFMSSNGSTRRFGRSNRINRRNNRNGTNA